MWRVSDCLMSIQALKYFRYFSGTFQILPRYFLCMCALKEYLKILKDGLDHQLRSCGSLLGTLYPPLIKYYHLRENNDQHQQH